MELFTRLKFFQFFSKINTFETFPKIFQKTFYTFENLPVIAGSLILGLEEGDEILKHVLTRVLGDCGAKSAVDDSSRLFARRVDVRFEEFAAICHSSVLAGCIGLNILA